MSLKPSSMLRQKEKQEIKQEAGTGLPSEEGAGRDRVPGDSAGDDDVQSTLQGHARPASLGLMCPTDILSRLSNVS